MPFMIFRFILPDESTLSEAIFKPSSHFIRFALFAPLIWHPPFLFKSWTVLYLDPHFPNKIRMPLAIALITIEIRVKLISAIIKKGSPLPVTSIPNKIKQREPKNPIIKALNKNDFHVVTFCWTNKFTRKMVIAYITRGPMLLLRR